MAKTYFINQYDNLAYKNKLDELLNKTFRSFNHLLIDESNLHLLDDKFNEIIAQYKATKGRCAIPKFQRDLSWGENPNIILHVSHSCSYHLILVKGEVK